MSRILRHFTIVGDDHRPEWKKEEDEVVIHHQEKEHRKPPVPVSRSFRDVLKWLYSRHRFQIAIVCLVVIDALFVLCEILLDLEIIKPDTHHIAPQVFHYLSLSVLTFFVVEIFGKLYAYRLEFFHHKFEILDAVVVLISFIIDIIYIAQENLFQAVGLLILLRLWRVARIINGIIVSIKTTAEEKITKLRAANHALSETVEQLQQQCKQKEDEIDRLQKLLQQHQVFPAR
ncbi:voltage-gated hydrogen channel 1 [Microcaecilia unicolor]|uniref:Voltage-gated hydrogen channel 1 n=1 Tax=Microcaecilia unicolor TaxID=1415580 RepID=A0A6P7ZDT5_9AMPH|nr:voltage-gated hydrogen channel 1 [Microcaecilia unicolor]XP_030075934.1 voltage-gated hydrogen channel 1 [Microcaecilia unicolor]XP_030075935.1 voltage-gated hydrogen channel 1 [Microcaecilia unicolor]XP_030075936.1 voltage-gated hydrogen channel 1 [Microcaecilia unicolor]XP_030075937.1 voltage-gated hydrogen channel 1 [Microcaecilia unicolor]XP_030075938.1 voltage-gated hydrogen channel 1 [Microcaecilia unicolor]XP_030075940.1 voltage-gated hydrogen channel 1 [Microcaecilia unicolor]